LNIAYFDPIGGASGDMIVGSLVDAGADARELARQISLLGLGELSVACSKSVTHQIACTRFHVHEERHTHDHGDHHTHHHHRNLADIEAIIGASGVSELVKSRSLSVFRCLAEAEAEVHGATVQDIHFHEVGAVDSIADIVGACVALELLGVSDVFAGPFPLSRGTVKCAHGEWPVPGPATARLLKGFRWRNTDIEGELVTPTAAAFFAALGQDSRTMPEMSLASTGYGAGQNDYGIPNVLRVCVGEAESAAVPESVCVIETCLDDHNPELLDHAMSRLLENGALDVWFTPIQMKKNRPATQLNALCDKGLAQKLINIILLETSTLGVRHWMAERTCLPRHVISVPTASGPVRVKIAGLPDGSTKAAPEYDDVRELAARTGRPARLIYTEAIIAAHNNPQEADTK